MIEPSNLLRVCCRVLIFALFAGIAADFVASKTVTRHPEENTEPCDGKSCDHLEHKLDQDPAAVQQMHQKHDGTEEQDLTASRSDGLNIDPDSLLHPAGASHVHDGTPPIDANEQGIGADAPDVRKELHGGLTEIHTDSVSGDVPYVEEVGPDMEATLHGGLKHVHGPEAAENQSRSLEHDGVIGVDPEEMLHGRKDAHNHGESNEEGRLNSEGNFDIGTDIEAILHGGDAHVHSPERRQEPGSNEVREVPIGATDPEAFLHDGNGHVHAHGAAKERHDPDPRPYGAADPDQVLHRSDENHVHTARQAMDGSRPLSSSKDPDVMGMDVNPMDIRVGTLRPEDKDDYHKWKSEKEKQQAKDPSRTNGWLSGFSYIKEALLRDLESVRKRYLPSIFGETEGEEEKDSTSTGNGKRTHDEA